MKESGADLNSEIFIFNIEINYASSLFRDTVDSFRKNE